MPIIPSYKLQLEHPLLNELLDSTMLVWHVVDRGLQDRNISSESIDPQDQQFFIEDVSILEAINNVSERNFDNSCENNFADISSYSSSVNSPYESRVESLVSDNYSISGDPSLSYNSDHQNFTSPDLVKTPRDSNVDCFYDNGFCGLNSISLVADLNSTEILREGYVSSTEMEDGSPVIFKKSGQMELKENYDSRNFSCLSERDSLFYNSVGSQESSSFFHEESNLIKIANDSSNTVTPESLSIQASPNLSRISIFDDRKDQIIGEDFDLSESFLSDDTDFYKYCDSSIDNSTELENCPSNIILPNPKVIADSIINTFKSNSQRPFTQNQLSFFIGCDRARILNFSNSNMIKSGFSPFQIFCNQFHSGFGLTNPRILHRSQPTDPSDSFHLTQPSETDILSHLYELLESPCLLVISLGRIKLNLSLPSSEQNHIYGATHQELIVLRPILPH